MASTSVNVTVRLRWWFVPMVRATTGALVALCRARLMSEDTAYKIADCIVGFAFDRAVVVR